MRKIFFFLFLLLYHFSFSQTQEKCAFVYADSVLRAQTPGSPTLLDYENWLQPKIAQYLSNQSSQRGGRQIYTIPVVVHVIHNGEAVGSGRNISQAQVNSQIDVLNEDFRRLNADASQTLSQFLPIAADVEIEFCLARVDPNGVVLAEPGIHRYNGGQASWSSTTTIDNTLKPATIWDPNRYFNIWTVDFGGGGLLGYAQFPQGSGLAGMPTGTQNAQTDGIVVYYRAFGRVGNVTSPYNRGRTTTHEAGHWLGLRHIWGDGGCAQDDFCADTPPSDASSSGCNLTRQSCGGLNMVQNYMDYTNDCQNIFTQNQKTRMVTTLLNATRRASLLNSTVCQVINPVSISGQVRDAATLQGIPNAKVRFVANGFNYTATCNATGNFTISNIAAGTYTLYAGQWGYITKQTNNVVVQTGVQPIVVNLNSGYYDDFVLEFNWTKTSTATTGAWVREVPVGTTFNNAQCAPGADVTSDFGGEAYITGNGGGSAGTDDVDGGVVTLTSPVFNLANSIDPRIHYSAWFFNDGGSGSPDDTLIVRLSNGQQTVILESNRTNIQWAQRNLRIRDFLVPTANMTVSFTTMDLTNGHLVEAGIDLFRITDTNIVIVNPPVANFSSNIQSACAPLTVNFTDNSTNTPTSWNWSFPGGNPSSSSVPNPTNIVYNNPGTYNVTLIASNQQGSNTITKQAFITVQSTVADFSADITSGCQGLRATFSDVSSCPASSRVWLFPGGLPSTSTAANPQVLYNTIGQFDVTLIEGGDTITKTNYISTSSGGILTVLNENFESNSFATNGWTVENPDNSFTWQIFTTAGNTSGTRSTGINLFDYTTRGQRDRLVSKTLDLTNVSNTTLTFKHAHRRYAQQGTSPQNRDSLIVYVSSDGGANWTRLLSAGESGQGSFATNSTMSAAFTPQVAADWCFSGTVGAPCFTLNLSAYDGQPNVKIRFESVNDYGNFMYLDDIVVSGNCNAVPNGPIANFDADITSGCGSVNVQFSDQSANNPISWIWAFPGGTPATSSLQNPPVISYSTPGTYPVSLKVTNADGSDSLAFINYINVFSIPSVSLSATDVSCFAGPDGNIVSSITNGTAPYTYNWSNGSSSANPDNLVSDSYTVTVTDANGCSNTATADIIQPSQLLIPYTKTDVDCGLSNGSIDVTPSGGTAPYTYLWDNNEITSSVSGLSAGVYEVIVTDANGCVNVQTIEIMNSNVPDITDSVVDVSCYGINDGSIFINISGGTPPYNYNWSNGANSQALFGLVAGPYLLTVTDADGCFVFQTISVGQPDEMLVSLTVTDVICKQKFGSAIATVSGGIPPYSYLWSNSVITPSNNSLEAGAFGLTVTDSTNCSVTATGTIIKINNLVISTSSTPDNGTGNGTATVTFNGTPPYIIEWSDSQTTATATGLTAGDYIVTVEDSNGCITSDTVTVYLASGVASSSENEKIKVYPNPTSGKIVIEFSENINDINVTVLDVLGREITTAGRKKEKTKYLLNLSGNAAGIYFIHIMIDGQKSVKRIILSE
jgi:PKD repeat protein